jgi:hypothetical protein
MAAEAQPVPPTAGSVDDTDVEAATGPTTGDRLRSAARRAKSIWCGILSGLG